MINIVESELTIIDTNFQGSSRSAILARESVLNMENILIEDAIMTYFFQNMVDCELTIKLLTVIDSRFSFMSVKSSTVTI